MKSSSSVGPAQAGLERILVVCNRNALVGRQMLAAGVDAHAIERSCGRVDSRYWLSASDFFRGIAFAKGARRHNRIRRRNGLPNGGPFRLGPELGRFGRVEWKGGGDGLCPAILATARSASVPRASERAGPPAVDRALVFASSFAACFVLIREITARLVLRIAIRFLVRRAFGSASALGLSGLPGALAVRETCYRGRVASRWGGAMPEAGSCAVNRRSAEILVVPDGVTAGSFTHLLLTIIPARNATAAVTPMACHGLACT